MSKTGSLMHIAVVLALLLTKHNALNEETVMTTRQLQQYGGEILITNQNVSQLNQLVADAQRNTVFIFAEDVSLPSVIEVDTPRLTFRGDPDVRPSLTCADDEEGFTIHANRIEVENLIFRNCTKTAVRVFDKASVCDNPFDPECQPRPPQRLDVILTDVGFIDNVGTEESSGGGGFHAEAMVHALIRGCRFERNTGISGGAISFGGSSLRVENSSFVANVASNTGGAIFAIQDTEARAEQPASQFTIVNTQFEGNSVLQGGFDLTEPMLTDSIPLEANPFLAFLQPTPSGGAIYVASYAEVGIEDCAFESNHAVPAGGAIYFSDNQKITIRNCAFDGNYAEPRQDNSYVADVQLGGAIFVTFYETTSDLSIERCTFKNNSAVYGGALHYVGPTKKTFNMRHCRFIDNRALLGGGAMVFRNIMAPGIQNTIFRNNTAFVGGAIFVTNGAGLSLTEGILRYSRFEGNIAFDGGAIFGIGSGTMIISHVFFVRNKAQRNGGAVCLIDATVRSYLELRKARMHNNSAETGGAMYIESVSAVSVTRGAVDTNAAALGLVDNPHNEFFGNSAVRGGAIYYKGSNLILNRFVLDVGEFTGNRALSNLSAVFPEPLNYPNAADRSSRLLFEAAVRDEDSISSDADLLDPKSANPCHPGGGGAICMVLNGIANRAPTTIEIGRSNFTQNTATVGGAMMISTDEDADWDFRCRTGRDRTSTLLTSNPCRNLNLRAVTFRENRARAAGGALMVSNLKHLYYSEVEENSKHFNYQTLDNVKRGGSFIRNRVQKGGYGEDIAGTAVRLSIRHPNADPVTGILIANQSSGQAHSLPPIEIQVLDGLDQVVTGGIVDASLAVCVDPVRLDSNGSIAAGQVVSTASSGVAVFDALSLSAFPGQYEISFSVRGSKVEAVSANVTLRECRLGERYNSEGFVCEACAFESFTFYVNVSRCADCPDNARCTGNASLVPASGYWHSSPFSVIMHECFHDDACSYDNRQEVLETSRRARIQEFLERFDQGEEPVFTNEEYAQCSMGYEGPLCGSCTDGYGNADGKTCVKCSSKSITAAVISLLGVWQLIFLAITIRSALVSIRDMNQMMVIAQQQNVSARPVQFNTTHNSPSSFTASNQGNSATDIVTSQHRMSGELEKSEDEDQFSPPLYAVPSPTFASPIPISGNVSRQQQYSADYIIAAQHVSETIKIFVNFFQVTSIAVNINLEWTASVKNMLAGMNSAAGFSNGATFVPMTCLLGTDSDSRSIYGVILRVAFPLFSMILVMCLFVIRGLVMLRKPNMTFFECQQFLRSRLIICFLVVGFFAYQSISEDLMGTVSCIRLDSDDMSTAEEFDDPLRGVSYSHFSTANGYYWTEDTNIKCFSRNHAFLVGFLGIPGIVLFLCGIPFYLLIFLLYKRQKKQLMELHVLNTYGFIYQNYEDKFVYWEVIILIRKAMIGAIIVFAYPLGANLQGVMVLGVLNLALAVHLIATPFKYRLLNMLEGCSLIVSIITFYAGVVFNDTNTSDGAKVLLSVILMFVNALLMVVILFSVFVHGDKYVLARLKSLDVTDIPENPILRMTLLAFIIQRHVKKMVTASVNRTFLQRTSFRKQKKQQSGGTVQMKASVTCHIGVLASDPDSAIDKNADTAIETTVDPETESPSVAIAIDDESEPAPISQTHS